LTHLHVLRPGRPRLTSLKQFPPLATLSMPMLTLPTIIVQSDAPPFHPRPCDLRITCTYHLHDLQQPTTPSHIRCLPLLSSRESPFHWTSWISNRGSLLTWRWPHSTILDHPPLLLHFFTKQREKIGH